MATTAIKPSPRRTARLVRQRIEAGGERIWRFEDFDTLPLAAVAQALSRLYRSGKLQRLGKGLYFQPRETVFGASRPTPVMLCKLAARNAKIFPAGYLAASSLGFTTQNPAKAEIATTANRLSRLLMGKDTVVHTGRPVAWELLSETDGAVLEFLRQRGASSELPAGETIQRLLALLAEKGRYVRLARAAATEPPRVRAMLGALGEEMRAPKNLLKALRASLNPLSRFDFGIMTRLECARLWQAKEGEFRANV